MRIEVHIERLILEGLPVDRSAGSQVRQAVQAELSRLLAENVASESSLIDGATPALRTAPILISAPSSPIVVGEQIASAVHGGLRK